MDNVQDSSTPESLKHESFTPKSILLITDHSSKDILFNTLKTLPFISQIRIGSLKMAPQMTEINYIPYDCIIYDLKNSSNIGAKDKEIEQYIKNDGGSILVTHDVYDSGVIGPLYLLGLEHCPHFPWKESNKAIVCSTHELFSCYKDLSNKFIYNIATTHKTSHRLIEKNENKAKVLMNLMFDTPTNNMHDYLVVNEIGLGRTAYWAAGHSNTISEDEKELFVNIVAWLLKYKK